MSSTQMTSTHLSSSVDMLFRSIVSSTANTSFSNRLIKNNNRHIKVYPDGFTDIIEEKKGFFKYIKNNWTSAWSTIQSAISRDTSSYTSNTKGNVPKKYSITSLKSLKSTQETMHLEDEEALMIQELMAIEVAIQESLQEYKELYAMHDEIQEYRKWQHRMKSSWIEFCGTQDELKCIGVGCDSYAAWSSEFKAGFQPKKCTELSDFEWFRVKQETNGDQPKPFFSLFFTELDFN